MVGHGDWEALYDVATHDRLVAMLTDPSRRTSPPSSATKYLLSGIARCGICDGPMRVLLATANSGRTRDSYVCQQSYHVRRSRLDMDEQVTKVVLGVLASPEGVAALTRGDSEQAQQAREQAAALRAQLDLAADSFARGDIEMHQLARITAKLRPEAERAEQVARSAASAPDLLDLARPDIAKIWESLPLARKRAVIAELVVIKVDRTTHRGGDVTYDPDAVRILPRER